MHARHKTAFGTLASALLLVAPLLMGADGKGCQQGDVSIGGEGGGIDGSGGGPADGSCKVTGCSGELCAESGDDLASTCEWKDEYACYQKAGICERGEDGACGWRQTPELSACLENPPGEEQPCVVSGCSGERCVEAGDDLAGTCEWQDEYACYQQVGVCERSADSACGWRETPELSACLENPPGERTPASGACIKSSGDACATDADCKAGGCGGELCFNPAKSEGISSCECTQPEGVACGCVAGTCAWWN